MQSFDKKRVAIIGLKGLPAIGGSARATEELVTQLHDKYQFVIYSIKSHMLYEKSYRGFEFIIFKAFNNKKLNTLFYYIKSCLHCLFVGNYDLIHLQHLYSGLIVPLLKLRYKVITTVRGIVPGNDNKWTKLDKIIFRIIEYISIVFSDKIISVAKPHLSYLQKYTSKEILYIPNGIRIEPSKNIIRKNYILFSAARIIHLKGCHLLLDALQKLNYKDPVIIIGDINQVPSYKRQLLTLSQNLNIRYIDIIKEKEVLFSYLREARFFIFPSYNEGMSNMLLEAASCKSPIITSDIIENKAIFSDEEVLFFKSGDSTDLMDKITWALHNFEKMLGKTEKAFNKLISEYNWEQIAEKYSKVYDSLMH